MFIQCRSNLRVICIIYWYTYAKINKKYPGISQMFQMLEEQVE